MTLRAVRLIFGILACAMAGIYLTDRFVTGLVEAQSILERREVVSIFSSNPGSAYPLQRTPVSPDNLKVYRNGMLQAPNRDYALVGRTVNFFPVSAPKNQDILQFIYDAP